jgi:hypothetical protein
MINKPRAELYAFWRDFATLPRFMSHVKAVETEGNLTRRTIAGPLGGDVRLETRIVGDREGEQIAWRSTEASDIDPEGKVLFLSAILPIGWMAAENGGIKEGDTVAARRCGPAGLFAVQSALLMGAGRRTRPSSTARATGATTRPSPKAITRTTPSTWLKRGMRP